jgi:uncharacterized protein (DUF342 family)
MTDTPKKLVVDIAEGTQRYVDLTPQEIAQLDQLAAETQERREEEAAAAEALAALKESAKAKLIAGTPLTEEEAATLIV